MEDPTIWVLTPEGSIQRWPYDLEETNFNVRPELIFFYAELTTEGVL